jgi:phage-related protein
MPSTVLYVFKEPHKKCKLLEWLTELESMSPKAYYDCFALMLRLAEQGFNLRRPATDILRDHIWELRAKEGRVHYRILYFFCGKNEVCLSHGFAKEGEVPDIEIERAIAHAELVKEDRRKYTAIFTLGE